MTQIDFRSRTTTPPAAKFDVQDYLKTPDQQAAYLVYGKVPLQLN
jgi:hypothetical protein